MTENDWDILLKWNSDPDVLYFAEGDDVNSYTLEQVQQIYRGVSQKAFCFMRDPFIIDQLLTKASTLRREVANSGR